MWTAKFWKDALERTIKTFAQALAGFLSVDGIVDKINMEWGDYLLGSAITALVAFLMALAGTQLGAQNTASWLPAEHDTPRPDPEAGQLNSSITLIVIMCVLLVLIFLKVFGVID